MARPSNSGYEPAPQHDSLDDEVGPLPDAGSRSGPRSGAEVGYTQPPPSYQATDEGDSAPNALLQPARNEDDSVPDHFKYGGFVADAPREIRMQFLRKVYVILTAQILVTTGMCAVGAFVTPVREWMQAHNWVALVSMLVAIVFFIATYWKRKSYPTNLIFLSCFTLLEGFAVSSIVGFYDTSAVVAAAVATLAIFVALSMFASQTKYDFTSWQPYLMGALWIFLIFSLLMVFFPGRRMETALGIGGAILFSIYIVIDTQMILRHSHVEEEIMAAISLYLDIINLFLSLLRIMGNSDS